MERKGSGVNQRETNKSTVFKKARAIYIKSMINHLSHQKQYQMKQPSKSRCTLYQFIFITGLRCVALSLGFDVEVPVGEGLCPIFIDNDQQFQQKMT